MQALSQLYPRRTSDIDKYMERYGEQLRLIAKLEGFDPKEPYNLFENQRVAIGRGHGHQGEALILMKRAVEIAKTSFPDAEEMQKVVQARYERLLEVPLPLHSDSDLVENVGQEVSELAIYLSLFNTLFFGMEPSLPPSPSLLRLKPNAWLNGIPDAISELSKVLVAFFADYDVPNQSQLTYELRYRNIAKTLMGFVNEYVAVYGRVINNNTRRDFFSTFRGKVLGAELVINKQCERLYDLIRDIRMEKLISNLRP